MPVKLFATPPSDDQEIWRFMDLRKFRDLMANQELYFRRADLFTDESEGMPPDTYAREVLGNNPYDINQNAALRHTYGSIAQSRAMYFLTCWHLHREENLDMWAEYGHDGVAVCSTYGKLKETLLDLIDDVHVGVIRYGTEHLGPRMNVFEYITTKQVKYEFERELRILLTIPDPLDGGNRHFDLDNRAHDRPLDVNNRHSWVPDFTRRRIDVTKLVTGVVISPWAEPYAVEEIPIWLSGKKLSPPRHSTLRSPIIISLKDYKEGKRLTGQSIEKPEPPEPEPVSKERLQQFFELISPVEQSHLEFLYRSRWEACQLKPGGLPLQSDIQYLETNWRVLDNRKKKDVEAKKQKALSSGENVGTVS